MPTWKEQIDEENSYEYRLYGYLHRLVTNASYFQIQIPKIYWKMVQKTEEPRMHNYSSSLQHLNRTSILDTGLLIRQHLYLHLINPRIHVPTADEMVRISHTESFYAFPSKNLPTKSEGNRDRGSSISLKYCITCVLCLSSVVGSLYQHTSRSSLFPIIIGLFLNGNIPDTRPVP